MQWPLNWLRMKKIYIGVYEQKTGTARNKVKLAKEKVG